MFDWFNNSYEKLPTDEKVKKVEKIKKVEKVIEYGKYDSDGSICFIATGTQLYNNYIDDMNRRRGLLEKAILFDKDLSDVRGINMKIMKSKNIFENADHYGKEFWGIYEKEILNTMQKAAWNKECNEYYPTVKFGGSFCYLCEYYNITILYNNVFNFIIIDGFLVVRISLGEVVVDYKIILADDNRFYNCFKTIRLFDLVYFFNEMYADMMVDIKKMKTEKMRSKCLSITSKYLDKFSDVKV